eukprot:UN17760
MTLNSDEDSFDFDKWSKNRPPYKKSDDLSEDYYPRSREIRVLRNLPTNTNHRSQLSPSVEFDLPRNVDHENRGGVRRGRPRTVSRSRRKCSGSVRSSDGREYAT